MNRSFGTSSFPRACQYAVFRKSAGGVLRRHRDRPDLLARVLTPLQPPRCAPTPRACAARNPCTGTRPGTEPPHPPATAPASCVTGDVRPPLPQRQHRHQIGITRHLIGQLPDTARPRPPLRVEPEPPVLQPVQQPLPQRPLLPLLPRLARPPPLILRPLQQPNRTDATRSDQAAAAQVPGNPPASAPGFR